MRKRISSAALAVGWAVTLLAAVFVGQAVSAPSDPVSNIVCNEGDQVYTVISDFPELAPGANASGSQSAEEALNSFLSKTYPNVKNDFRSVRADAMGVVYQKLRGDGAIAHAVVRHIAGGYEVARFTACNSLLVEGDV